MSFSRRRFLTAGGGILLAPLPVAAETAGPAGLSAPQDIVRNGTLRIAMPAFASEPFFPAHDRSGDGIDMDLANGIARALGARPIFIRTAETFDETVAQLNAGEADLVIGKLSRTLQRGRTIIYSRPYAMLNQGLIANRVNLARIAKGQEPEQVIRSFSGSLGVIEGSSFAGYAPINFPRADIRRFPTWTSVIAAIRQGSIDMAYRDDFEIKKLMVDDPSMTVVARSITLTDKTDTIAVGIRPDNSHLAAFVDLYIDLERGARVLSTNEIIARYRKPSEP